MGAAFLVVGFFRLLELLYRLRSSSSHLANRTAMHAAMARQSDSARRRACFARDVAAGCDSGEAIGCGAAARKRVAAVANQLTTCELTGTRPKRSYSTGSTNRFSNVDVNRPPRMTIAIGYSTSYPGLLPLSASGSNPRPAARAVMRMGETRSAE